MRAKLVMVHSVTSSSAEVQIQQLILDNDMSHFYSYLVQYKESGKNYTDAMNFSHKKDIGSVLTALHGLKPGTGYAVRVLPVRTHEANNISEAGLPTRGVAFTTGTYFIIMQRF